MSSRIPLVIAVVMLVTTCVTAVSAVGWHHALAVMGALAVLLLLVAAVCALNPRVPYAAFQKVHGAAATGAVALISLRVLVSVIAGSVRAPVASAWALAFAAMSLTGVIHRLRSRLRRPSGSVIESVVACERAIELSWPTDSPAAHTPGQFVLLTATVDGRRETHPFTLTNRAGAPSRCVLVRAAGDWTDAAHRGLRPGDTVRVEGPYGAFTPGRSGEPEVWVAGGAGITPFLSVLRTAVQDPGAVPHPAVHLVYSARDTCDAPCWEEVEHAVRALPWLTLQPALSAQGGRLTAEALGALATDAPAGAHWYLCGPTGLVEAATSAYLGAGGRRSRLHAETYRWR
ncbi:MULTISPECIES: FAD-binding oxidoreductase [unclassified Actinomyces]|uniref:FAD-binding oxidoreductase n=1 Tax=unclassified Actinomyces TaxID=2609248 RepID=UPI002016D15D|nr:MULTISPECIES: FAD-binding oxidoreductase [unclassified Actinomyces]MCL3794773.1 hypothetical protein [Actinomyces sp. 217892]